MPIRPGAFRSRRTFLTAFLSSVSALTLMAAGAPAQARPLFGGANASAAVNAAVNAAMASVQQAQQATQQSRNSLSAAVRAIQAMQGVQSAAHSAAAASSSSVPNGLAPGGLTPNFGLASNGNGPNSPDPAVWQGASQPSQSTSGGQTTVTVVQNTQKAILTWSSFNVGANTTLYFNQSAGNQTNGNNDWIALNRIIDPTGVPSQILGQIKAEGSVYLINGNGIIFGGASQINVHTLIASSLGFLGENLSGLTPGSTAYDAVVNGTDQQSRPQCRIPQLRERRHRGAGSYRGRHFVYGQSGARAGHAIDRFGRQQLRRAGPHHDRGRRQHHDPQRWLGERRRLCADRSPHCQQCRHHYYAEWSGDPRRRHRRQPGADR